MKERVLNKESCAFDGVSVSTMGAAPSLGQARGSGLSCELFQDLA